MKPCSLDRLSGPERIFNYRLSCARIVIENVFGFMSARFRILRNTTELGPEKSYNIVVAICILHNFLNCRAERLMHLQELLILKIQLLAKLNQALGE